MMGWAYEEGGYEGKRIRFEKKMHDNKDKRNNRFLTLFDISMSDILQDFRPADILGVQQAIKGFDKPGFCEVILIYL
jgi:hypothetical protein